MDSISPLGGYFSVTFKNLKHGVFSAVAWSGVWLFAFIGSNIAVLSVHSDTAGVSPKISAIALTFAVIAGNSPKILSYVIGCDTDFRHLFVKQNDRDFDEPKPIRLIISLAALILSVTLLINNVSGASELVGIIELYGFVTYSYDFYLVIILLFIAQVTFSWPEPNIGKIY